jgi:hypothetical protein
VFHSYHRLVLLAALVLFTAPPAGAAPTRPWDAEEVAQLAQRFTVQTKHIQESVGRHVEQAAPNSPRRVVLDDVYEIHHRAISLDTGVRAGLGRDQTEPVFRRLLGDVRNAQQDAKRFPEIEKVRKHVDEAHRILVELNAYYGVDD